MSDKQPYALAASLRVLLADGLEPVAGMKCQRAIVGRTDVDLTGNHGCQRTRVPRKVVVQKTAHAATAGIGRNHDSVDVHETGIPPPEPQEVRAPIFGIGGEGHEESKHALADGGHAKILGCASKLREVVEGDAVDVGHRRIVQGEYAPQIDRLDVSWDCISVLQGRPRYPFARRPIGVYAPVMAARLTIPASTNPYVTPAWTNVTTSQIVAASLHCEAKTNRYTMMGIMENAMPNATMAGA